MTKKNCALICIYGLLTIMLMFFLWSIREFERGIPVLNYHQINPTDINALTVSPDAFDEQMKYLHDNGYNTISPDDLRNHLVNNAPLPAHPILITFDDGYRDNYEYAYPILKQYDMKATIFLVSDFMDRFDKYLTWKQVYEMSENNIYMGSHTLSHIPLTQITPEEMEQQLMGGKLAIEWNIFKFNDFVAYPCGDYDQQVLSETKKAGYKGGFTVYLNYVHSGDDPYTLNRIPIYGNGRMALQRFWLRLHFATTVGQLERLQTDLMDSGHTVLAGLIPIP